MAKLSNEPDNLRIGWKLWSRGRLFRFFWPRRYLYYIWTWDENFRNCSRIQFILLGRCILVSFFDKNIYFSSLNQPGNGVLVVERAVARAPVVPIAAVIEDEFSFNSLLTRGSWRVFFYLYFFSKQSHFEPLVGCLRRQRRSLTEWGGSGGDWHNASLDKLQETTFSSDQGQCSTW